MQSHHAHHITPRLVVQGADEAIAFYRDVFGAELLERYAMPDGHVVHAALNIGNATISLAEERLEWGLLAPGTLGGSAVLLTLQRENPDATCEAAVAGGAEVRIPIADQFYGYREGRIADPFGHLWILSKLNEQLSQEEIGRRMEAFGSS